MQMKTCIACGEEKLLSEFYRYLKKVGRDHDGYRPNCISCDKIREAEGRKRTRERESGLAKAALMVPGIKNLPCTICWHYDRCRDTEVDCPSFRKWTLNGKKNNYSKMPDRYLTGGEFAIEL